MEPERIRQMREWASHYCDVDPEAASRAAGYPACGLIIDSNPSRDFPALRFFSIMNLSETSSGLLKFETLPMIRDWFISLAVLG